MEHKVDVKGNKISVSYFGDIKEKMELAKGYIEMYNQMASKKNMPQVSLEYALKKIKKQHDRFYNLDNKYNGKGKLR